jgi:hypothetical protein
MVSELFGAGKNISDEKRSHFDYWNYIIYIADVTELPSVLGIR